MSLHETLPLPHQTLRHSPEHSGGAWTLNRVLPPLVTRLAVRFAPAASLLLLAATADIRPAHAQELPQEGEPPIELVDSGGKRL